MVKFLKYSYLKNAVAELQNRIDSTENWISNLKQQVEKLSFYISVKKYKEKSQKNNRYGGPGERRRKTHSFRSR